jgi:class 3 adenylate cyclase/tetratricopeptide (TPR) repeat protein
VRCSKCGSDNREGRRFCGSCGSKLGTVCSKCGAANEPDENFCGDCGAALGAQSKPTAVPPPNESFALKDAALTSVEGERKTVTALFADLKGSTELMASLDPEEARAIVDPALRIMVDAVRHYEGYVVQSTGDGVFALFGAPAAYEDHPQRSINAALQMQHELREYAQRLANRGRPSVEFRIGINTGEVVVRGVETGGRVEYTPIGHTANLASRLQTMAPAGAIAVSEYTRKLVEGYFELGALGQKQVKGIGEPIEVYEVTGPGPLRTRFELSTRRGLTKFVGREREIHQMKHALDLAMKGHGQLVAVVAEAGSGKSRLFHEFKATLPPACKVLEAYSVSHGRASAWLPVLELLRGYFGIRDFDDPASRREKVRAKIAALEAGLTEILPYLWGLLEIQVSPDPFAQMDPRIRRQRTLDGIKRIIIRESLNQPTVVIFEDLHWLDSETQALLDLLAESIAGARLLLLVNYRPEYRHEWSGRTHYLQLRLDPLIGENAAAMLTALLGHSAELDALKHLVAERTGGNPFFIEEMVQALFEQGILARNGTVKLIRPLSHGQLPVSVQGLLAARIDRLRADDRDLLHTLAVLGRQFPLRLVQGMAPASADELQRRLSHLQSSGFIYEQPAMNDIEYVFKHALTQEVAYNSLLIEQRKVFHERAAKALEALFADSVDEHLLDLSFHYSRCGDDSRAIDYLVRAAQQAQKRSAYSQAAASLEEALKHLNNKPASPERDRVETALRRWLADSAIVMNGYAAPEYEHHLTRRHELVRRRGDNTEIFYSLVGMSVLAAFRLQLGRAHDVGWKLIGMADHEHVPEMQVEAHGSLANVLWLMGDFLGSREHAEKGLALGLQAQNLTAQKEHMLAACQFYSCLCTAALGFPDQALRQARRYLASTREQGALATAFALNSIATLCVWRREGAQALGYADTLLALTSEHGFSNWYSFSQIVHGQAQALLGKTDEAITELKMAMDSFEGTGAVIPGWMYASLAFAFLVANKPDQGVTVAAKGLEVATATGNAESKPELHRLHGELLLMGDPRRADESEMSFREAIDVARKQCAKSSELRASTSLARLLAQQDRRDEAQTILAEIYNWFTEGFDTADLTAAKALLDELCR